MNRIKEVLEEKGIKKLGLLKSLERALVYAYVFNRKQPSLEGLFEIAENLQVDVKELINNHQKR